MPALLIALVLLVMVLLGGSCDVRFAEPSPRHHTNPVRLPILTPPQNLRPLAPLTPVSSTTPDHGIDTNLPTLKPHLSTEPADENNSTRGHLSADARGPRDAHRG